jgi:GT2 family glycosyltransferase
MKGTTVRDLTVAMATCDDDPEVLALSLLAILAQPLEEAVIIVDMSRGDGVRRAVEAHRDRVRYIDYRESTGHSDSRNRLVELVGTRYMAFIDADAVPAGGWAEAIRAAFGREDRAAVVGARCLPVWSHTVPPRLFGTRPALEMLGMYDLGTSRLEVPRIVGTSFALDRERLPSERPFRDELGRTPTRLHAGEEWAYCLAVRRAGWTIQYEPDAVVHHFVRPQRVRWSWMLQRAFVAGQESHLSKERLEPLPRSMGVRDQLFRAVIAPFFLAGRVSGLPPSGSGH